MERDILNELADPADPFQHGDVIVELSRFRQLSHEWTSHGTLSVDQHDLQIGKLRKEFQQRLHIDIRDLYQRMLCPHVLHS